MSASQARVTEVRIAAPLALCVEVVLNAFGLYGD